MNDEDYIGWLNMDYELIEMLLDDIGWYLMKMVDGLQSWMELLFI